MYSYYLLFRSLSSQSNLINRLLWRFFSITPCTPVMRSFAKCICPLGQNRWVNVQLHFPWRKNMSLRPGWHASPLRGYPQRSVVGKMFVRLGKGRQGGVKFRTHQPSFEPSLSDLSAGFGNL